MSNVLVVEFPNFNIYSTPLLVLVIQGLIFTLLLLARFYQKRNLPDLLLAIILLITCYHRTTYTIGFMDWYDTFRNTKINYYLVSMGMLLAPLIFFYVKSITTADFRFRKKDYWHFLPWVIFFITKLIILIYDSQQAGFNDTQNGYLVINFQWKYVDPVVTLFATGQMLLYLAFTIQLFFVYRKKIEQYFSNTYKLELNWIRNFLLAYSFLFVYGLVQIFINEIITSLHWTQKWWLQFFSALVVLYVGIKGYFTDTVKLTSLNFESTEDNGRTIIANAKVADNLLVKKKQLEAYFEKEQPYLNPDLNLIELSEALQMNRAELSDLINTGFGCNFNDFVNGFRIKAVKSMFEQGKHQQLSLLGIALESGFNSKATFNRVFKKQTSLSPTEFIKRHL